MTEKELQTVIAGIDLCDDFTQMSCLEPDSSEPVPVGRVWMDTREYECPTVLGLIPEKREWFFGNEALERAEEGNILLLRHFVQDIAQGRELKLGEYTFDPTEVMARFLLKFISCLKEYYPNRKLAKLVVTVSVKTPSLTKAITEALAQVGILSDRLFLQPHKQSYMYYALSQKRELWMNNVGLFEFDRNGLFYSQINIDRRTTPFIVGVHRKDLSQMMNWDTLEETEQDSAAEYTFLNLANTQLHKQMVTFVYVTGEGFQGEWAGPALKQLCNGRRVFRGQNLFTKGACYAARELLGQGVLQDCLFLDEEMIYCNITMKVYADASSQELLVARAGTPWQEVDTTLDVIPDEEDEIGLTVQNVLRHESRTHLLSLEGFSSRPNKMTRFTVRLRFADVSHCIVTLKDNGFGEYCPSSNRIWERYIDL